MTKAFSKKKLMQPGLGIVAAFLLIMLIMFGMSIIDYNMNLLGIIWLVFPVIGVGIETVVYFKRKPAIESGNCKPSHPFAKVGLFLFALVYILFILSARGVLKIPKYSPPMNEWFVWNLSGMLWSLNLIGIIVIILSALAITRALRSREFSFSLPIVLILFSIFFIWANMTFFVPIALDLNAELIRHWFGI